MKISKMALTALCASSAFLSHGEGSEEPNLKIGGLKGKVGLEMRGELYQHDKGLLKTDDYSPSAQQKLEFQVLNLKLEGNINDKTEYKFRLNLIPKMDTKKNKPQIVDYATASWWPVKAFGLSIGQDKIRQGGWDNKLLNFRNVVGGGIYTTEHQPFAKFSPILDFHLKMAGKLTLEITNDVLPEKDNHYGAHANAQWNIESKPTWILEWIGDFKGFSPMVRYGSYDNDKSFYANIGARMETSKIDTYVDYVSDARSQKVILEGKDKDESKADTLSSINFDFKLKLKKAATPFLYVSQFDNAQAAYTDSKGAEHKDRKYNTDGTWDDNGMVLGLGTYLNSFGDGFEPYFAIVQKSGKFLDPKGAAEGDPEKTKGKSESYIKLGVSSFF